MLRVLVYALAFSAVIARASEASLDWVAYGDLRGYLEPCGCDPATDMGGVRRIATVVQRERMARPGVAVFSLGNLLAPKDTGAVKLPFLIEADAAIAPTASLFNVLELERAEAIDVVLRTGAPRPGTPPYVLSNLASRAPWTRHVRGHVKTTSDVVLGFVSDPRVGEHLAPLDEALLKRWSDLVKAEDPEGARRKVLLFAGGDAELARVMEAKLFDVIVSSNVAPFETDPGLREKHDEALLKRRVPGDVWMVPLGGQGLLRGGVARYAEAPSVTQIFAATDPKAAKPVDSPFAKPRLVTWLLPDVGGQEALADLFTRYNAAAKDKFQASVAARAKDLATSPYAGVQACASCHVASHKTWSESRHAKAMATLQAKGKDQDPECVACHVVGAKEKGGFVSMELSPQLANVQCEVCHGPRKEHAANPTIKPALATPPREVCVGCHNEQHSPRFDPVVYWERIKHAM